MLLILFIVFFCLIGLGTPVAFALALGAFGAILITGEFPLNMIITRMFVGIDSFPLMAIPFFIIAGEIMNTTGITKRIIDLSNALVGHIRGGLAHVNVVASMFFAGVSGSATADTSAIGSMIIPAMVKDGYPKDFSVAVTASSSTIGPVIPPSIMMILYGVIANVSIAQLFLGGIIPGVTVGFSLMFMVYIIARRAGYGKKPRVSLIITLLRFKDAAFALVMPIIILGGILSGIFTPTEAGVIATVYAFIIGIFVYRTLKFSDLPQLFLKAAVTTSLCLFLISTASIFGWLLAWEGFASIVTNFITSITQHPKVALFLILAFLLILGLFIEGIPVLIIFTPILVPVAKALGINLVHFGVVLVMVILIGSVTPPVGILLYICCAIAEIPVTEASKIIWPFVLMMVIALFLVAYIPGLITFIPSLVYR